MSPPFRYVHRVRIDEVDAAGIVFFARYFGWCHEAMASMLEPIDGGYAGLLKIHGVGLPTVHVEADYFAPLRFGDTAVISVAVDAVGTSSCALAFRVDREDDATRVASIRHVVVLVDVRAMRPLPFPGELRALLDGRRGAGP